MLLIQLMLPRDLPVYMALLAADLCIQISQTRGSQIQVDGGKHGGYWHKARTPRGWVQNAPCTPLDVVQDGCR